MTGMGGNAGEVDDDIQAMVMDMMSSGKQPSPEELGELLNMMAAQSRGDFDDDDDFDLGDLFGMDDDEYEENENPKYPIGSSVRVKNNCKSEVDDKTKMKGWEGRIGAAFFDDNGDEAYMVEFDSHTIKQMTERYIERAVLFGEEFQEHFFLEKDIIPAQPRDKKIQALAAYRKRFHEWIWTELDDPAQGQRIKNIMLNNVSLSDEQNWKIYLNKHLNFPFAAKTKGIYSLMGIPEGLDCQVYGIEYFDANNGFIMSIKPKGVKRRVEHPLVDLELKKGTKKMREVLDDYSEWGEEVLEF